MAEDHEYSDLSIKNLGSVKEIMKQATFSFRTNLFTFLLLSLWIFSHRTTVESGTEIVISIFDTNPSLKTPHKYPFPRNPLPFRLYLTRLTPQSASLFSGEDESDHPVPVHVKSPRNGTSSLLLHHFEPHAGAISIDNQTHQTPEMVHSDENQVMKERENRSVTYNNGTEFDQLGEVDNNEDQAKNKELEEFIEMKALLNKVWPSGILGLVSAYIFTNSLSYGMTFHIVVSDLIGRKSSFFKNVCSGAGFGFLRVIFFCLLRWLAREISTYLLSMLFIADDAIVDLSSFIILMLRLKLIPISIVFPWIHEFSKENPCFFFAWWLFDSAFGLVFALGAYITIVNSIREFYGKKVIQEGYYLVCSMLNQAVIIKCLEDLVCGSAVRFFFTRVFGNEIGLALQTIFEVYFMVVWLIFYLVAKCRDAANSEDGRRFGRKELDHAFATLKF